MPHRGKSWPFILTIQECSRTRFGIISAVILWTIASPLPALSSSIEISGNAANVVIDATDAQLTDILNQLSEKHGFRFVGYIPTPEQEPVTVRLEGPLLDVLEQLLGKENHLIERADNLPDGISRLILYGRTRVATGNTAQQITAMQNLPDRPLPVAPQVSNSTPSTSVPVSVATSSPSEKAPPGNHMLRKVKHLSAAVARSVSQNLQQH